MVRWRPGARERLQAAALERFAENGFDRTTVADIAATAGLTERTFFRHFADKREVIFAGQHEFEQLFLAGLDTMPVDAAPMRAVTASLDAASAFFGDDRREWSRARQAVIDGDPSLQEREALKLTSLATALADSLRRRGVGTTAAELAAQSGVTVFRLAFGRWITDGEDRALSEIQREVMAELRALLATRG